MMRMVVLVAVIGLGVLGASPGRAQFSGETPEELEGIEIVDRSGEFVPEDLAFVPSNWNAVTWTASGHKRMS